MTRWQRWIDVFAMVAVLSATSVGVIWASSDVTRRLAVSQIDIFDAREGEPIYMEVARILRSDFSGSYRVTIRDANGDEACSTGRVDVGYSRLDEDGQPTQFPDPLNLSWWAWGGTCTAVLDTTSSEVNPNALESGEYSQETCHGIRPLWGFLPPHWHCWPITTFRITE